MSPLLLLLTLLPSICLGQAAVGIVRMQSTMPSLAQLTGSLTFIQTASNVTIQGTISGLPPNTVHALHIHQFGDLNGGLSHPERLAHHFNPFHTLHGLVDDPTMPPIPPAVSRLASPPIGAVLTTSASQLTASTPIIPGATLPVFQSTPRHVGDIGNIIADGSGTATINVARDLMQLTLGDASIVGRGVALHLLEDRGARFQPSGAADGIIAAGVVGIANTPSNIAAAPDQSQAACLLQGVRNAPISGQLLLTPGCVGANAVMRVQAVVTGLERGTYEIHMMTYGDLVQGVGDFWNPVPLPSGLACNPSHVGDFGTIESTDPSTPATLERYYPLPGEQGLGPGIGRGCAIVAAGTANVLAVGVIGVANEIGAPPDTTTATPVSCLPTTPTPPTTAPITTASLATSVTDDSTAAYTYTYTVGAAAAGMETVAPILSPAAAASAGSFTSRSRSRSLAGTSHSLPFFTAVPFAARLGCSAQPPSPLMTVRQT